MEVRVEADFFDRAEELRAHFYRRVAPSKEGPADRFVWDYWHLPEQYTYLRTPSPNVVPPSLLEAFLARLASWGDANLGCDRATLPWLSYYVDGCRQELHSDVAQGTWSYVYSLTRWEDQAFGGGETLVATPRLLDYWGNFEPSRSSEARHLVDRVPARFNQLCVFDSRLPHGVAAVEGTRDPLQSRVALHGWFHPPAVSVHGSLDLDAVRPSVADLRARVVDRWETVGPVLGTSTWRLVVDRDGSVGDLRLVVHNLVPLPGGPGKGRPPGPGRGPDARLAAAEAEIRLTRFPPAAGRSTVRVPFES
ncbi:MAG: 2OG-Fe(II) oxygenase [Acidimicrobiales bacterium]